MDFGYTYARYLEALPREKKCACGTAVLGRCSTCSQLPEKEIQPPLFQDQQLSLFPVQEFTIYNNER